MAKIEVGQCKDCRWWDGTETCTLGFCKLMDSCYNKGSRTSESTHAGSLCYIAELGEEHFLGGMEIGIHTSRFFGCVMFETKEQQ